MTEEWGPVEAMLKRVFGRRVRIITHKECSRPLKRAYLGLRGPLRKPTVPARGIQSKTKEKGVSIKKISRPHHAPPAQ